MERNCEGQAGRKNPDKLAAAELWGERLSGVVSVGVVAGRGEREWTGLTGSLTAEANRILVDWLWNKRGKNHR